jgi:hypothetical protein
VYVISFQQLYETTGSNKEMKKQANKVQQNNDDDDHDHEEELDEEEYETDEISQEGDTDEEEESGSSVQDDGSQDGSDHEANAEDADMDNEDDNRMTQQTADYFEYDLFNLTVCDYHAQEGEVNNESIRLRSQKVTQQLFSK